MSLFFATINDMSLPIMKAFVKVVMLTVTINTTNNVMRYNVLTI